jgi:hypothetical protein
MKSEKWYRVWCGEIAEISVTKVMDNCVDYVCYGGGTKREAKERDCSFIAKTIKECTDWYLGKVEEDIERAKKRLDFIRMKRDKFKQMADALEYQNGISK